MALADSYGGIVRERLTMGMELRRIFQIRPTLYLISR